MGRDSNSICLNCLCEYGKERDCPHCGAADGRTVWASPALEPGTMLSEKYLLGRTLGRGGFAVTYLGLHVDLGIRVAIKEFFPQELAERDRNTCRVVARRTEHTAQPFQDHYLKGLQRFIEEGRNIVRCHEPNPHPNLVRVTDYFEANGTAYLVMNYVKGRSLAEYLDKQPNGRLAEDEAVRVLMPVMDGLRTVHDRGFCHRDVKPANIYISDEGAVILIDFGAARTDMQQESRTQTVFLTPGYAPPEQYSVRGAQGPWTDVYGCAATLYRCVTGADPVSAMDRLAGVDLVPPSAIPGCGISGAMEQVILLGLESDRSKRPQSIRAYQQRLQEAGRGHASAPGKRDQEHAAKATPESPQNAAGSGRRSAARFLFVPLVLLIAAALGIVFVLSNRKTNEQTAGQNKSGTVEDSARAEADRERGETVLARGMADTAAVHQYALEEWKKAEELYSGGISGNLPFDIQSARFREARGSYQKAAASAEERLRVLIEEAGIEAGEARKRSDTLEVHQYATRVWEQAERLLADVNNLDLSAEDKLSRLHEAKEQYESAIATAAEEKMRVAAEQQEAVRAAQKEAKTARQRALDVNAERYAESKWGDAENSLQQAEEVNQAVDNRLMLYADARNSYDRAKDQALDHRKRQEDGKAEKERLAREKQAAEKKKAQQEEQAAEKISVAQALKGKAGKARTKAQEILQRKSREFSNQSRSLERNQKYTAEIEPLLNQAEQLWNNDRFDEAARAYEKCASKLEMLKPEPFTGGL